MDSLNEVILKESIFKILSFFFSSSFLLCPICAEGMRLPFYYFLILLGKSSLNKTAISKS